MPTDARTIAQMLAEAEVNRHGGLRAGSEWWSWPEVVTEARRRARLIPVTPGRATHVGLLMDNTPEHVFWLVGTLISGNVVVSLNTSRDRSEIADDARQADVDLLVTEDPWRSHAPASIPRPADIEARGESSAEREAEASDTGILLFSSGSTGRPKAVIVSQGRLATVTAKMVDRLSLTSSDVTYLAMPLFHGNSIMLNLLPAMRVGATVVLRERFSASAFTPEVLEHGVTFVNYVGRALSYVLKHPLPQDPDRSRLRLAFGTEAAVSDQRAFAAAFGCVVDEGYGMSEGVLRITRIPGTPEGALGVPADGVEVGVLDSDGAPCPVAELDADGRLLNPEAIGEIVAVGRGGAFEGYYNSPDAEAERVRGDDFWTGDLGYRDADGWLWFAGRGKDSMRIDGENIATAPVERHLAPYPGCQAVAVVPVPDPVTADALLCVLEVRDPAHFDIEDFARFLDERHTNRKWRPAFVRLVTDLPVTGSGKVDKPRLQRDSWALDPTWCWDGKRYRCLDEPLRAELSERYREAGRERFLPTPARPH